MKRTLIALLIFSSLLSCKKEKENCTYTTSDGTYFGPTPPTPQQVAQWEAACSCDITVTKTCD